VLERLEDAGCSRYVVTDVTKDGTLKGPNLELLREVTSRTTRPVVASGGISNLDDIAALRELVLGVEARSSARRSMRAPSRSPRRWMSPQADSAGVPWAGRSFEPNPHAGDDGSADPRCCARSRRPRRRG
jgi:tRNA-dihydrouridine synthase